MLLSEAPFGAALAYAVRGTSDLSKRSANFVVQKLKQNKRLDPQGVTATRYLAQRMAERRAELPFAHKLSGDAVLVPMPRAGLLHRGALWPAFELAKALQEYGFGGEVSTILKRSKPMRKAATATSAHRPKASEHFESMDVDSQLTVRGRPIVVVDDVITRGATMLGAMPRLRACLVDNDLFGFAAARTISTGEIEEVFDPTLGTITLRAG